MDFIVVRYLRIVCFMLGAVFGRSGLASLLAVKPDVS
jgi:hypothetical protein